MRLAALRNHKARLMIDGQKRTFDLLRATLNPENKNIWIHASSLGEFEQGRPLIERIKSENPDAHIVLSFFSPSGYEVRKNYDKVDVVCYLPFDVPSEVRKFIDLVNPSMAIFVKYEFWGNYLCELKRRAIPTYIISSIFREGQIFFRPWGGMFRDMLRCFTFSCKTRNRANCSRLSTSTMWKWLATLASTAWQMCEAQPRNFL